MEIGELVSYEKSQFLRKGRREGLGSKASHQELRISPTTADVSSPNLHGGRDFCSSLSLSGSERSHQLCPAPASLRAVGVHKALLDTKKPHQVSAPWPSLHLLTRCRQAPLTASLLAVPSQHSSPGLLVPLTLQQHRGDASSGEPGLRPPKPLGLGSAQSALTWGSRGDHRGWLEHS